ncbi:tripartite tricarboxylate transporter substrate binding protein [Pusillimonas sp. ANT_WB101]|uniref:Bug family tripartite tricarboxylate transporter substrate binding protein n=1 Tax=Pusillimonas sp. ANT_WB101 TaxID=2597356 RepID=UPI0011ED8642|nr:tripartite tricarboxylate transporter substrate binding protein [Pusillimonas sp. ANT_WB101]KAA0889315.1 tripartite tricarboxylate transporter substrate binding protein [Pusillimonas sp. ANT_WB101]
MLSKKTLVTAVAALVCAGPVAQAANTYPDKPIALIIGFAPGGPTDAIGRVLFKKVSEELKVPIVIENRPGAGGNIGAQELLRAKPDGYTLMYGTSSITTAPALFAREDLNPKTAFVAAGCSVSVPLILLTSQKTVDAKNAESFYKDMKNHPDKYFMGSSGNGSIDHLVAMDIANKLGLKFQHVPYKGNGPALTDLAGGNTNFMYSGSFNSAMPFIQDGRVKPLAVTSNKRSVVLPDVPTLSESVPGLEGFDGGTWQVLLAPKGTSTDILKKLDQALQKAMKDPAILESLRFQGAEVMNKSPQQCQDFIDREYDRWSDTISRLGLKAG